MVSFLYRFGDSQVYFLAVWLATALLDGGSTLDLVYTYIYIYIYRYIIYYAIVHYTVILLCYIITGMFMFEFMLIPTLSLLLLTFVFERVKRYDIAA